MVSRLWWFVAGLATGAVIVARALDRRPDPGDVRDAAVRTGADLLDLTARAVRPKRTG